MTPFSELPPVLPAQLAPLFALLPALPALPPAEPVFVGTAPLAVAVGTAVAWTFEEPPRPPPKLGILKLPLPKPPPRLPKPPPREEPAPPVEEGRPGIKPESPPDPKDEPPPPSPDPNEGRPDGMGNEGTLSEGKLNCG